MISDLFVEFIRSYKTNTERPFAKNNTVSIISDELPRLIGQKINNDQKYEIYGSYGRGNWAETPWLGILNRSVTKSTQRGYYIVYLINVEKRALYISLAAGWTQFAEKYSNKNAAKMIVKYCKYLSKNIVETPTGFRPGPIDLSAKGQLSRGYELGQILSKKCLLGELNDDKMIFDLKSLITTYENLVNVIGNSPLNIDLETVEQNSGIDETQKKLNRLTLLEDADSILAGVVSIADSMPPEKKEYVYRKAVRNKKIAEAVKIRAEFICEICGRHPFIQKSGEPYAEADHRIPLGEEGLDHPHNMRCLCAQCHAIVTHGSDQEIKKIESTRL